MLVPTFRALVCLCSGLFVPVALGGLFPEAELSSAMLEKVFPAEAFRQRSVSLLLTAFAALMLGPGHTCPY